MHQIEIGHVIAERILHFRSKTGSLSGELRIQLSKPYLLEAGMVNFPFKSGTAGCSLKFIGLDTEYYDQEVYGADSLQALQLAAEIDPTLERISKDFALYFPDGEPYFE